MQELQQIELFSRQNVDNEAPFRGMKVSKQERKEVEHEEQVLRRPCSISDT